MFQNVQYDTVRLAGSVAKERQISTGLVGELANDISTFKNTPMNIASKNDPSVSSPLYSSQNLETFFLDMSPTKPVNFSVKSWKKIFFKSQATKFCPFLVRSIRSTSKRSINGSLSHFYCFPRNIPIFIHLSRFVGLDESNSQLAQIIFLTRIHRSVGLSSFER